MSPSASLLGLSHVCSRVLAWETGAAAALLGTNWWGDAGGLPSQHGGGVFDAERQLPKEWIYSF